jgi:hypothetical protein
MPRKLKPLPHLTIPECRDELMGIATRIIRLAAVFDDNPRQQLRRIAQNIRDLVPHMKRVPHIGKRRLVSKPVTPIMIARVKEVKAARPELTNQELAAMTDTNVGRISEILRGMYDEL